jgi:hypothetical protein
MQNTSKKSFLNLHNHLIAFTNQIKTTTPSVFSNQATNLQWINGNTTNGVGVGVGAGGARIPVPVLEGSI